MKNIDKVLGFLETQPDPQLVSQIAGGCNLTKGQVRSALRVLRHKGAVTPSRLIELPYPIQPGRREAQTWSLK